MHALCLIHLHFLQACQVDVFGLVCRDREPDDVLAGKIASAEAAMTALAEFKKDWNDSARIQDSELEDQVAERVARALKDRELYKAVKLNQKVGIYVRFMQFRA